MKLIVGYTKNPEPRWPYVFLGAMMVLCVVGVVWLGASLIKFRTERAAEPKKQIELETSFSKEAKISVEKMVFTKKVDNENYPTDRLDEIQKDKAGIIYCYSMIHSSVLPQPIRHVWINPDGLEVADIRLYLSNYPAHTWSYVNLAGSPAGKWRVEARKLNNEVVAEKFLLIYE